MDLCQHDQDADAGEHAVDHRRRDRPEPAADPQRAGQELDGARSDEDGAQRVDAVLTHELEDDDGEARGRAADLKRRAGEEADDDTADDSGDQAALGRYTGGHGDAHAEGHRHEEDDEGRGKVPCQGWRDQSGEGGAHGNLPYSAATAWEPTKVGAATRAAEVWATGTSSASSIATKRPRSPQ